MEYNPEKHHRRSIRLQGYDYTKAGAYYVTICTQGRVCLFAEVWDEMVRLNSFGKIIQVCWDDLMRHFLHVRLDSFVVMPNHVHGIIITKDCDDSRGEAFVNQGQSVSSLHSDTNASPLPHGTRSGSLGAIIQNFKSVSTRKVNKMKKTYRNSLWQRNYYEHIIRNEKSLNTIRRYIKFNPLMWAYDSDNPGATHLSTEKIRNALIQYYGFTDEECDIITNFK